MLLFLSAKFFRTHPDQLDTTLSTTESREEKLEELTKALQVLQNGNNLATSYLELLESDHWGTPCTLSPVQNVSVTAGNTEQLDHLSFPGAMSPL